MRTLCALGLCLALLPCAAHAASPVGTAAEYDAAVSAAKTTRAEIPLSGKSPIVFPARTLPADVVKLTFTTPDGPVMLQGGAVNGRLLHTEVEDATLDFTGSAPITFTNFRHHGRDNIKEEGWGGAFYAANGLVLNSSNPLVFFGNLAKGGDSSGGSTSHSSGQGGAFCVDGRLEAGGAGPFLFFGNTALAGTAGTAGSVENSGQGGAIYAEKGMYLMSGSWVFTGNLAQGADGQSLKSEAYDSGYGGALNSTCELILAPRGNYAFIGNRAMGGKASLSGDCDASGQGGAVYCVDNMEIHNGVFLLNMAGTTNSGDMSSGVGGGVYHEAFGNDYTITLKANRDNPIFFAGNTHNPGGKGAVLNSFYFGNTTDEGTSHTTFVVDCESGATAVLLDPIAGQPEGTAGKKPADKIMDVAVSVHKVGPGLWILGGDNRMAGPTDWRVEAGTLRLTRDAFGGTSRIALTSKLAADFTVAKSAVLEVTPWEEPATVTASSIELAAGSAVRLADAPYQAVLRTDSPVVLLRLEALAGKPAVNAQLPETSGTISVGGKKYAYRDLAWKTDGNKAELSCVFTEADSGVKN